MPFGETFFYLNLETSDGLRSQSEAPNIQNDPSFLKICTSPSDKKKILFHTKWRDGLLFILPLY